MTPKEMKAMLEGRGLPRVDGPQKVSGAAKYTADINLKGMLFARSLDCPCASAQVRNEPDVAAAERIPGVRLVQAPRKGQQFGIGARIALAVAETQEAADAALAALKIELEPQKQIVSLEQLVNPEDLKAPPEVEAALQNSDAVAEGTYFVNMVQHCSPEPHCAVVHVNGEQATVWESSQGVGHTHRAAAKMLDLPAANVHTIVEFMGGGFGNKLAPWVNFSLVCELAKQLNMPVKMVATRASELMVGGGRSTGPGVVYYKIGGKVDGSDVAEYRRTWMGGPGKCWYNHRSLGHDRMPGKIAGVGPTPPLRAPGTPEPQIVQESMLDDLAEKLGIDPLDLRLKIGGRGNMARWFEVGAKEIGWERRQKPAGSASNTVKRGIGVGCGEFAGRQNCHFAEVEVDTETGVVRVLRVVAVVEGGYMNRLTAENQVHGGVVMGMSWALFENRQIDRVSSAMLNANMEFYKIAGAHDAPEVQVIFLGGSGQGGGIGEAPVVPIGGAVSNAVFNAIGKRVYKFPITPRRILEALEQKVKV